MKLKNKMYKLMRSPYKLRNSVSRYGAAAWSFVFGMLHASWASGYYVLLPAEQAAEAFKRNGFFIYNLIVVGICILGFIMALIQSDIIRTRISTKVLRFVGYTVVVLLALRGVAGLIQVLYLVIVHDTVLSLMTLWDVWFCLGAFLYFLNLRPKPRVSTCI
jgi:hypothetical protein